MSCASASLLFGLRIERSAGAFLRGSTHGADASNGQMGVRLCPFLKGQKMDKVSTKRNASYERWMYGLAIHDKVGGAGNVQPVSTEAELRQKLAGVSINP